MLFLIPFIYFAGLALLLFSLTWLSYFIVNRALSRSRTPDKYSRDIPDIHPAVASVIDSGGFFSVKRIFTSSLLHLVNQGFFVLEKTENKKGEPTFILKHEDGSPKPTGIDKVIFDFVLFVRKKTCSMQEKQDDYDVPLCRNGVVYLEYFPIVQKAHKKEFAEHVQHIIDAVNNTLRSHGLVRKKFESNFEKFLRIAFFLFYIPFALLIPVKGTNSLDDLMVVILYRHFSHIFWSFPTYATVLLYILWLVVIAFLAFFFPYLLHKTFARYTFLSAEAMEVRKDLCGLQRWLEDFTLLEEKEALDVQVWHEYMVFAAALDVPQPAYDDFAQFIDATKSICRGIFSDSAKDWLWDIYENGILNFRN